MKIIVPCAPQVKVNCDESNTFSSCLNYSVATRTNVMDSEFEEEKIRARKNFKCC